MALALTLPVVISGVVNAGHNTWPDIDRATKEIPLNCRKETMLLCSVNLCFKCSFLYSCLVGDKHNKALITPYFVKSF